MKFLWNPGWDYSATMNTSLVSRFIQSKTELKSFIPVFIVYGVLLLLRGTSSIVYVLCGYTILHHCIPTTSGCKVKSHQTRMSFIHVLVHLLTNFLAPNRFSPELQGIKSNLWSSKLANTAWPRTQVICYITQRKKNMAADQTEPLRNNPIVVLFLMNFSFHSVFLDNKSISNMGWHVNIKCSILFWELNNCFLSPALHSFKENWVLRRDFTAECSGRVMFTWLKEDAAGLKPGFWFKNLIVQPHCR